MDRKTELKRQYRENPPAAGVFVVTNRANGKVFVGSGHNVQGVLNSQRAQLKWHSHMTRALQQDFDQYGETQFEFAVVDTLEPSGEPGHDLVEELRALEALWLDKLQPYGDRGYNPVPRSRAK
ncbi:MAG: GIY-YIG nuclease family protein [Deltaproteobacteria bacterium]|nr:GIY-YIG nuclease family protein [Deltaproteobacteria bacterium]